MEREPDRPVSRTGGLVALGGSMLVVSSMFMPWSAGGARGLDFWHLAQLEGVADDRGTYQMALLLMLTMVGWCAAYFLWRSHESRLAWAFGGFSGAALLYGGDLRLTGDIPAASYAIGETVAAAGIFVVLVGCVFAVAGNIAESRSDAITRAHR